MRGKSIKTVFGFFENFADCAIRECLSNVIYVCLLATALILSISSAADIGQTWLNKVQSQLAEYEIFSNSSGNYLNEK